MQLEEDNLVTNELWSAAAMPDVTVTAPTRRKLRRKTSDLLDVFASCPTACQYAVPQRLAAAATFRELLPEHGK